jgi:hypothetical protein
MNLFAACGISLSAAALLLSAVLAALLQPLSASLTELCGARERGVFWTVLSGVCLTVGSLLLGLLGFWWGQAGPGGRPAPPSADASALFWAGVAMLRWTVAAILIGLSTIAAMLLTFTKRLALGPP